MERQFKGIWIPAEIWLDENLTVMEKVLYAEIDSFCGNGKECFCSNAHFAKMLQVSERRVQQILTAMESKGVITRTVIYKEGTKEVERRYLKPTYFTTPHEENFTTPHEENFVDTNTVFTNTNNTIEEEEEAGWREVMTCYQNNIRPICGEIEMQRLHSLYKECGRTWVLDAIQECVINNVRKLNYLQSILDRWQSEGKVDSRKKTEAKPSQKKRGYPTQEDFAKARAEMERRMKDAGEI